MYAQGPDGWHEQQRLNIHSARALARDPRGALLGYASGLNFEAWLPGVECSGSEASAGPPADWTIECRANDDPWAITQPPLDQTDWGATATAANTGVAPIRAFYNAARNYFTGVLAANAGADLPPFYSAALIPRAAGNCRAARGRHRRQECSWRRTARCKPVARHARLGQRFRGPSFRMRRGCADDCVRLGRGRH